MNLRSNKPLDWIKETLDLDDLPSGKITYGSVEIFENRIGDRVGIPVLAAKGKNDGPTIGLIACVHGNEINGIPVIHELFGKLDPTKMNGTVIGIPVVNVLGYLSYQREFIDNMDLNRVFPGNPKGSPSQIYAHAVKSEILSKFNFLLDFHTASFGRVNSHYVRVNPADSEAKHMASLQHAQIVVNAKDSISGSGTIRNAAANLNIPAITIELGNPQIFQENIKTDALSGVWNILYDKEILIGEIDFPDQEYIYQCKSSTWIRVQDGGILQVPPKLNQILKKGERIAYLKDIYGRKDIEYFAPEEGIVVGKNVNPVVSSGERILHFGTQ